MPISEMIKVDFYMNLIDELHYSGLFYIKMPWENGFGKFVSMWHDPVEMMFMGGEL